MITPGFVNAHSHIEYAVYAGFGDGLPFVPWIGMHIQRKAALDVRRHGRDRNRGGTRVPALGRDDDRGLQLLRRGRRSRRRRPACARSSTSRSSRATGRRSSGSTSRTGASRTLLSDRVLLGVSPHAPYTCTIETYRACAELGLPQATHFAESAAERDWLVDGTGDWSPLAEFLVPPSGETGIRMLAAEGLLGPSLMAAHCVHADAEEIGLLAPSTASASRTVPARTATSAVASPRSRSFATPAWPCRSRRTAPRRPRRSISSRRSARRSSRARP